MPSNQTATSIGTSSTSCPNTLATLDTEGLISVAAGTFAGVTGVVQGSYSGLAADYIGIRCYNMATGAQVSGGSTITLTDNVAANFRVPDIQGFAKIRFLSNGWSSGACVVTVMTGAFGNGAPIAPPANSSFSSTFDGATFAGTASTFSVMPIIPTATVAATGNAIGNAAALTTGFTVVTGANGNAAVKLPAAAAGLQVIVKSTTSGQILKVFPSVNDAINGAAANAVYNHANLAMRIYIPVDAVTWSTAEEAPT